MNFQYENLIRFLREQLWQRKPGRSAGRASVMVGAGYSFNAAPSAASARPFPSWWRLTERLSTALYPGVEPSSTSQGTSGALRLAQEFEAVFGRFRLEELIRSEVPDSEHQPGELHKRLLALPWADVFTTNWDTLLERGSLDVHERLYDHVLTQSQIPSSSVPRIVKLHGTLPAHTPFIFTEEDYRSYPTKFAPFVNLVQQAMMENAFVLLGFSGDDPNFLNWSGWVRDNLGNQAPKIYLVNWLGLSTQRRRMLEDQNVIPIDLAALPQADTWPAEMRFRYANEWFLAALEGGRPPRASAWPSMLSVQAHPAIHLGWTLPQVTPELIGEPFPTKSFGAPVEERIKDLEGVSLIWKNNRQCFPKWFISPIEIRNRVWQSTLVWLGNIAQELNNIPEKKRLLIVRELQWRLDVCLIGPELVTDFLETLIKLLSVVDTDTRTIQPASGGVEKLSPDEMDGVRISLVAVARVMRKIGNEKDFVTATESLAEACNGDPELEQEARFERMLWFRDRLAHEQLEKELDSWDVELIDPLWGIRKAALLAGVERLHDAYFVLRTALGRVRRERRRDADDYASFSREAWGVWLTLALRRQWGGAHIGKPDERDPFDRWRDLLVYDCDAMGEYRQIVSQMHEPVPVGDTTRQRGFDLGTVSNQIHFRSGIPEGYKAATQMVSLADLTCVPISANNVSLFKDGLLRAANLLIGDWPLQSTLIAIRSASTGDDVALNDVVSRARVALLSESDCFQVSAIVASSFDYAVSRARAPDHRHQYWHQRLRVAVEVMSRLVLRASPADAILTLDRAHLLYELGWPLQHPWMTAELANLFSRTIESLPDTVLVQQISRLLNLPVPGTAAFLPNGTFHSWNDPFENLTTRVRLRLGRLAHKFDSEVINEVTTRLLQSGLESVTARRIAVARVLLVKELKCLKSELYESLGHLMWSEAYCRPDCLPADLRVYPWFF